MKLRKSSRNRTIGVMFNIFMIFAAEAVAVAVENGKIVFTSNGGIFTMNPNGSGRTQIADSANYPKYSPNGTKIAYYRGDEVWVINAVGNNERFVAPAGTLASFRMRGLSWSPDGNRIAFTCAAGICAVNADGSNRTTISSDVRDNAPDWSPDGTKFVFSKRTFATCTHECFPDIYMMNADGGNQIELKRHQTFEYISDPAWSPDGTKIAFSDSFFDSGYIAVMDADGSNIRFLFGGGDGDGLPAYGPSWSPDGTKIACVVGNYNEQKDIWVINANGTTSPRNITNTFQTSETAPNWGTAPASPNRTAFDFDGDGRADISVFRPSDRTWYLNRSTAGFSATPFGLSTDKITPADFDDDGKTDIAVYRDGVWYWLNSSNNSFSAIQFGLASDIPVAADYTGDGRAELAVYRNGVWWSLDLTNSQSRTVHFGISTDKPVAADYDGDGKTDQAVYRNGEWHLNRSSQGYAVVQFGLATDKPLIGDYDGDGKADEAVYRDGTWYLLRSSQGITAFQFGIASDIPAPADYDGDGRTDAAVYRAGDWWILQSTNGQARNHQFGLANDSPVPAAFAP